MLSLFYGTVSRGSAWSVASVELRGRTALHLAAWKGRGSTVELLLKHNADIEGKIKEDGPGAQGGRAGRSARP